MFLKHSHQTNFKVIVIKVSPTGPRKQFGKLFYSSYEFWKTDQTLVKQILSEVIDLHKTNFVLLFNNQF